MSHIPPDQLAIYRATAQRRWQEEQQRKDQRRQQAWQVVEQASHMLKVRFGATEVRLFGSLVHGQWFSMTSDIDLAAWGMQPEQYWEAIAALQDLSPDFSIDLVSMPHCNESLQAEILEHGKPV